MELASATPLDGHDYHTFRTDVGKLIFMAPWRPDMQFAIQQLSTQVLNPTTESWFKQVCWNSLVVVTQIGPAIRQHAKVYRT